MLVYGDHSQEVAPADVLESLAADGGRFLDHDRLRTRFITLAGLTQGVADADFEDAGCDRCRPGERALLQALTDLARALMQSWDAGCIGGVPPALPPIGPLPARVSVRLAEGYAFYALYPEAYGLAARMLRLEAAPRVIGLRSIGTGLAAVAAAALRAPPPITLRPTGHPFAREIRTDAEFSGELLTGDHHFVVADEGPGLSGSSFGCVADWLEKHGIAPSRIAFLPGHDGDLGPQASTRHRQRWSMVQRPVASIDKLRSWVEAVVGPVERWDDLSGGAWRSHCYAAEQDWPAINPMWERSKFRVRADGRSWLVRFAGLGATGEDKLTLARILARSGFGPEVAGLTHGWLIQRWHDEARPSLPTPAELTAYLRLRALFPAPQGASLADLVTMVRRNAPGLAGWHPPVDQLQQLVRPVRVDARLDPYEWLRLPSGQILKADALDHHQGHDLVGCQDLAFDVAGAAIELGLSSSQVQALEAALKVPPELTAFYRVAYVAFRLGAHQMSEVTVGAEEAARHRRAAKRYELALVDAVQHGGDIDQPLSLGVEAPA